MEFAAKTQDKLTRFKHQEDGNLVIFSLFMLVGMLLFTGTAIDVVRTEAARTKLQNTIDRAILAAADLDQTVEPEDVVTDYFEKAGLEDFLVDVNSTEGLNYKTVYAESSAEIDTQFIRMVGNPTLTAPAAGVANETITDVEISLVLDNSGSMNSNNRLNLLKAAAKDFLDIVIGQDLPAQHKISVNIIPFATQVAAGPSLLSHFNVTEEHSYSHCVNFSSSDFTQTALSTSTELQRTGHFDVQSWSKPLRMRYLTCPSDAEGVNLENRSVDSRYITFMAHEKQALKDKIDAMWAGGNTSIDVATKWGAALLDPDARSIVTSQISTGKVTNDFSGRPYDYTEDQVMKVLVVMSDGENTSQYMLRDDYRDGESPLFIDSENDRETYYHNRSSTSYDYYYVNGGYWRTSPYYDWNRAERQDWPEVWATRSVANFARYAKAKAMGGSWASYYYGFWTSVAPSTKNTRTSQICGAAKAQGVTVYTIGMDTYGQGDATLADCATSPAFFFDVDGLEIGQAFSAIARDINRLRLTN